jgi:hypothetical protein
MTTKSIAGLIVSAALIISPVAASAQIAAPHGTAIGKAATPDVASGKASTNGVAEKKVCKQLPSSTSRLPNRVCLTNKEWQQVEREAWLR